MPGKMANNMCKIEDWPKLIGVWFLLQVSILNGGTMVVMATI